MALVLRYNIGRIIIYIRNHLEEGGLSARSSEMLHYHVAKLVPTIRHENASNGYTTKLTRGSQRTFGPVICARLQEAARRLRCRRSLSEVKYAEVLRARARQASSAVSLCPETHVRPSSSAIRRAWALASRNRPESIRPCAKSLAHRGAGSISKLSMPQERISARAPRSSARIIVAHIWRQFCRGIINFGHR